MKNILVFNPSFIGDSVLTTPLIKAVKQIYPDSKTFFCVRPESAPIFQNLDFIDEIMVFDKRGVHKGVRGLAKFVKKYEHITFDIIISPHKSLRTTLLLKLFKSPLKIGFKQAVLHSLYDKTIKREMNLHEVERDLMLLNPLVKDFTLEGVKRLGGNIEIGYDRNFFENISKYLGIIKSSRKIVGFAPTSNWKTKMWPMEKYAFLVNELYKKDVLSIVFSSPSEKEHFEKFKSFVKVPFINFAMKTTLFELSSTIKYLDLLVCNDSAPLHIAVAHNTEVIAFFGPTVKEFGFYPYENKGEVIEVKNLYCRPCKIHGSNACPEKHFKCMIDIDENEVLSKIYSKLGIV